jgi:hypothetical protein
MRSRIFTDTGTPSSSGVAAEAVMASVDFINMGVDRNSD